MLQFADEFFGSGLKGDITLLSAMSVKPNEWLAHTENYMVLFKYRMGVLTMNMAETENDLFFNKGKIIATQDAFCPFTLNSISFADILELLDWKCDDWLD